MHLWPCRYAAIAFFEYNGEQYCPDGYNSSSYDISSDSSSSGSSSGGGDSSSSSSGRRLGSDGSDGSDGSSSGSAGSSGGDPPDGTLWMYENIYQFFRVCPGGGDAHVALLVLLPLIEIFLVFLAYRSVLMSTIATVKYFSVATAVEQVDNNIIGDIEQEKELEGDFQALTLTLTLALALTLALTLTLTLTLTRRPWSCSTTTWTAPSAT